VDIQALLQFQLIMTFHDILCQGLVLLYF